MKKTAPPDIVHSLQVHGPHASLTTSGNPPNLNGINNNDNYNYNYNNNNNNNPLKWEASYSTLLTNHHLPTGNPLAILN